MREVLVGVAGSKSGALVDDVATDEGRQDITRYGGVHAHVLVVGGNAYYSGNQAALIDYFELAPSTAKQIGSRWVLVAPSNSDYSTVAADATLSSALTEATPPGPLSETAPTTIDGESVIGIRGTLHAPKGVSASEILYVSRAAEPLPVQLVVSSSTKNLRDHSTTNFTRWGEPLALAAPTSVVTITPSS